MLHRRMTAALTLAVALSLTPAAPGSALPGTVQSSPVVAASAQTAASVQAGALALPARKLRKKDKKKWRRTFKPSSGVTFNTAIGKGRDQHAINRKIIKMMDASRSGTRIRVMSWNVMSRPVVRALLRAQRRGAVLRVLMADENAAAIENEVWNELLAGMAAVNAQKPAHRQSWAKTCIASCRGESGQAHSKFFLFSKIGRAKHVLIQGSANITHAAAVNQWNDIYTTVNRRAPYMFAKQIFDEMANDVPVPEPYQEWKGGNSHLIFHPLIGTAAKDPVLRLLRMTKCRGAKNTANGRTQIRIAPDVIRNARGLRIANKLRNLWEQGCDIRIGYTIKGVDVGQVLRAKNGRGPVPMKHLVIDRNGDGEFDKYFHLKAMSIIGNVKKKKANAVVLNGSANWSGMGASSDENVGIYWDKKLAKQYAEHIDYWFENFPTSARRRDALAGDGADAVIGTGPIHTPDMLLDEDDELVPGVDPYAKMDLD
ncbi:phospholipase D-like domain-containing protein [Nocardioides solisilvae]|uniref:phospholipase D-like domain-containing protein n=1 Tax=Nocardioides solisilvae TaxID=1542435 RepID=UPI0013A5A7BA|nr:phospholipase D-like domain-containing protein [Nocardioides solisilvae]